MTDFERYRDKIKDKLSILDVVKLYRSNIVRNGRKYLTNCLWHNDRHPSMEIDPEKGLCHCFSCHKGGDIFSIVQRQEGLDFKEAANFLAKQAGILTLADTDRQREPSTPLEPSPLPEPKPDPVFVGMDQVQRCVRSMNETSLYKWLCKEFDKSDVDKVLSMYHVGGSKFVTDVGDRAAVFPYIRTDGKCVDCKIFHLNSETGSRKTAPPVKSWPGGSLPTTWVLAEQKQKHLRADWCNFGDHLLADKPDADVFIVESEKSALIATLAYLYEPQYSNVVWVAVGSKNNLNSKRFSQYNGRKVTVFPDRDGYDDIVCETHTIEGWRSIARKLAGQGVILRIDTTVEMHYPKFVEKNGGLVKCKSDIADLIISYRHGIYGEADTSFTVEDEVTASNPIDGVTECDTTTKPQDPGPMPTPGTPEYSEWASQLAAWICSRRKGGPDEES